MELGLFIIIQYYVSIDDICKGMNMYLIHLDIEGYELKALNSGTYKT